MTCHLDSHLPHAFTVLAAAASTPQAGGASETVRAASVTATTATTTTDNSGQPGASASTPAATTAFLPAERFAVAPMVDVTDSVFRRMARLFSRRAMLYTEMIATEAVLHGRTNLLDFTPQEAPVCLQLGGCEPRKLYEAARIGASRGYTALNLNAGCPSDKVQSGNFGAILMKTPPLIAQCYQAMQEGVAAALGNVPDAPAVPVSVKTRIGVDDLDSEEFTFKLIDTIYQAGCRHVIIHARKAWLHGLSPKENRTVPPLDYARVYAIKAAYPDLFVTINGGITTIDACTEQLSKVDGVMLGRAVVDNPFILTKVDREIFGDQNAPELTADDLIAPLCDLGAQLQEEGKAVHFLYRHVLGLFMGRSGARLYRRYLSEHMTKKGASYQVLQEAYNAMLDAANP